MLAQVEFEITGIKISHEFDESSDLLENYGKCVGAWEPGVLVRSNIGRGEYRYFKSAQAPWRDWKASWAHVAEEDKASTIAKYGSLKAACYEFAKQDLKRFEDYDRNRWYYLIVKVEATIRGKFLVEPHRDSEDEWNFVNHSAYDAMYGLESDDPKDIRYWEEELTLNVRRELSDMGFSMLELDEAFSKIQRVD